MDYSLGVSRSFMSSKKDHLDSDDEDDELDHIIEREVQYRQDSTDSILHDYAGRIYDRVNTACHLRQCDQISGCHSLYLFTGDGTGTQERYHSSPIVEECEYCHSKVKCRIDCQRPALYSQKKRPPFDNDEQAWDEYDFPISKPPLPKHLIKKTSKIGNGGGGGADSTTGSVTSSSHSKSKPAVDHSNSTRSKGSWISGFFDNFS